MFEHRGPKRVAPSELTAILEPHGLISNPVCRGATLRPDSRERVFGNFNYSRLIGVLVLVQVCQGVQLEFGLRVVKAFIDNERLLTRQVDHLFMVYSVVC